jgi:hypothetical protein
LSYEVFITILLTAITVVLAALAALLALVGVGLGLAAFWGYAGIKDETRKAMSKAMEDMLKQYPSVTEVVEYIQQIKAAANFAQQMQNELVAGAETKNIESSSKPSVQVEVQAPPTAVEVAPPRESRIEPYPGEEASNVQDGKPADTTGSDSGPNSRQI